MTRKHRAKNKPSATQPRTHSGAVKPIRLPLIEHLRELRRRVLYIAASVAVWGAIAYAVERQIIAALLRPAHGQSFIYTSPIDGVNFLFKLCAYVGLACSIPVIVYNIIRFFEPLMHRRSARFVSSTVAVSGILALSGMAFGYFIGLPTALHFLLHQFVNAQIHPLLTIDAYLSFVLVYMLGSALMFQIPLIILFINRIKPLTPRGLWKRERWAILFAVILGGLMNPTPNLLDQLFVIGPIILSYQLAIVLVWRQNHRPKHIRHIESLRKRDMRIQAERLERSRNTCPMPTGQLVTAAEPIVPLSSPSDRSTRPRQYADAFSPERRTALFM